MARRKIDEGMDKLSAIRDIRKNMMDKSTEAGESVSLPPTILSGLDALIEAEGYDRDYWVSTALDEFLKGKGYGESDEEMTTEAAPPEAAEKREPPASMTDEA